MEGDIQQIKRSTCREKNSSPNKLIWFITQKRYPEL